MSEYKHIHFPDVQNEPYVQNWMNIPYRKHLKPKVFRLSLLPHSHPDFVMFVYGVYVCVKK